MSPQDVARAVARIARDFHARGDRSLRALFLESGYPHHRDSITESLLADCLREEPALIDDWVAESRDQRCSSGWYVSHDEEASRHAWTAGFHPDGPRRQFDDAAEACAFHLKGRAEDLLASRLTFTFLLRTWLRALFLRLRKAWVRRNRGTTV